MLTRDQEVEILFNRRNRPGSWLRAMSLSPQTIRDSCEETIDELINYGVLKVAAEESVDALIIRMGDGQVVEVWRGGKGQWRLKVDGKWQTT